MSILDDRTDCIICRKPLNPGEEMICSACDTEALEKQEAAKIEEKEAYEKRRAASWWKICDPQYRTGAISKMHPELQAIYERWDPEHPSSLTIVGGSGAGKTTAAYIFAKAAHFKNIRVRFWNASDLRQETIKAATNTDRWFEDFRARFFDAELLILDDLGNTAKSEASDEYLLRLIEGIRARQIPAIMTTQYQGKVLAESFTRVEIGTAIARRIGQAKDIAILK